MQSGLAAPLRPWRRERWQGSITSATKWSSFFKFDAEAERSVQGCSVDSVGRGQAFHQPLGFREHGPQIGFRELGGRPSRLLSGWRRPAVDRLVPRERHGFARPRNSILPEGDPEVGLGEGRHIHRPHHRAATPEADNLSVRNLEGPLRTEVAMRAELQRVMTGFDW